MEIRFVPRGIVEIDNARLCFRNFEGRAGEYNDAGDRNFAIVIPNQQLADELANEGWNVKVRPPRTPDDDPFMYLPVKVKFNERGPAVYLISGRSRQRLNENTVKCLDKIDIMSVDLDIRPYDWEMRGSRGRTAYLQAIHVTQNTDRFAARFADEEYPEE